MPVTIDTSLALDSNRDKTWDGDAAASRMAEACTSGDNTDADCMGSGFLWRDGEADAATQAAYKFPVADIVNGDKKLIFAGVTSAAGYLESAEGISDNDLSSMRSKLSDIYARFAKEFDDDTVVAPWESASQTAAADATDTDEQSGCGGCQGCTCGDSNNTAADQDSTVGDTNLLYDPVIRASASDGSTWKPSREWFRASPPAPLTITPEGRVFGDLARFGQRHIGADGSEVYPPRDPDGLYRSFRQRTITCDDGETIAVGVLTMDTGHAGMGAGAQAAVEHYDNTGCMVAAIAIGEDDETGGRIWLAGSLLPDVSDEQKLRLMLSGVSGDWRQIRQRGPLELVAALAVNVPGFPVPAVEVSQGKNLAVVAAGAVLPDITPGAHDVHLSDDVIERVAQRCVAVAEENAAAKQAQHDDEQARRVADERLAKAKVASGVMRDQVRKHRARQVHNQLTASVAKKMGADDDGDSDRGGLTAARRNRYLDAQGRNWVEQTGGLPRTIRSIANHLMAKGFNESHAIATAVNVVKKWCWGAPDGLNWPGVQKVKPQTRAKGCIAVSEWNLNRARARAD